MATDTQSRMDLGASLVRLWFLLYFGLMGFSPAGMLLFVLVTEVMRGRSTGLGDAAVMTLILLYAFFHISAFVQVLRRASWAWTFAVIVITFDLVLHGAIVLIALHPARVDLAQKIFLLTCPMFSLVLLGIPGVRPMLGSRMRAV